MNRVIISLVVLVVLCFGACKPGTPSQFIQPAEMEDILVEYHLARSAASENGDWDTQNYNRMLYMDAVLQKHGLTPEQFDSSLVYYYTRSDRFIDIYQRVVARLEDQAVLLGASEGEIGRFASLDNQGDTANIWPHNTTMLLFPRPPYHCYEFSFVGDSTFRAGDTFLFQFISDFVYQSGTKDAMLYLQAAYPDTVVIRQTRFSSSGLNQLRLEGPKDATLKQLSGFFYLGGTDDRSTTVRLLFISNIQLIRFHQKYEPKPEPVTTDSVEQAAATQRTAVDTARGGDSLRLRRKVLSTQNGATPNRMVERVHQSKSRR